jgi:hypothetical protein
MHYGRSKLQLDFASLYKKPLGEITLMEKCSWNNSKQPYLSVALKHLCNVSDFIIESFFFVIIST